MDGDMGNTNRPKRVLFQINTYMQLITAVQIQRNMEAGSVSDLVLSDHSVGAGHVAERLEKTGVFDRVRVMETKRFSSKLGERADRLEDIVLLSIGSTGKYGSYLWPDAAYDKIYYYNASPVIEAAYRISMRKGKRPICVRFEEGILSYGNMVNYRRGTRMRAMFAVHEFINKKNFRTETKEYCCYYPELFPQTGYPCKEIPHLSREDQVMKDVLNRTFDYDGHAEELEKKYIFFGSSTDVDGRGVGETEIVLGLADLVGKDNLLVKMHPRDGRDVYEKYGIAVSRNSAVPWEVIQINHDFSDHVFLTVSSGSVMSASALLGDNIPTYYLYPLVKGRNAIVDAQGETIGATVDALRSMGALQKIQIVDDLQKIGSQ